MYIKYSQLASRKEPQQKKQLSKLTAYQIALLIDQKFPKNQITPS